MAKEKMVALVKGNETLDRAKRQKDDEFYTPRSVVVKMCTGFDFKGKVVYLNCDNPKESNFWKHFKENFNSLGLSGLYASYLGGKYTTFFDGKTIIETPSEGDGDFRKQIDTIGKVDIVVSNPPFSLKREYLEFLLRHKVQFLFLTYALSWTNKAYSSALSRKKLYVANIYGDSLQYRQPLFRTKTTVPTIAVTNMHGSILPKRRRLDLCYTTKEIPLIVTETKRLFVNECLHTPIDYEGEILVPLRFIYYEVNVDYSILGVESSPKVGNATKFARFIIKIHGVHNG